MSTLCVFERKATISSQGFRIIRVFTICVYDQMVRVMEMILQIPF
jgi:very-short-patch-repair endonuclease